MSYYRDRIYAKYASIHQRNPAIFDPTEAVAWARPYHYYMRDWWPGQSDAAIVDLACGNGKFLHLAKNMGFQHVEGVDVSDEQIHIAAQTCAHVTLASLFEFLPKRVGKYDLITAFDLLEHLTKDEAFMFLDLCYAALKPGGRLVLQMPNGDTPWGLAMRYGDLTHEVCYTPHTLAGALELCGFTETLSREQGPVPWGCGVKCAIRYYLWRCLRMFLVLWNRVEAGSPGSGILTRVFITSAIKPRSASTK
jgi:2-polyprenyl-3-methyl-5-hydroxy-6-metoxy-1,4-benzoquinol methylase